MSRTVLLAAAGIMVASASGIAAAVAADGIDGPEIHWNYSDWGKPRASSAEILKFGEYISERTGGKWTMQVHWGTLSQPRATLDGLSLGAFQGGSYCASYYPGKLEAATGLDLPFMPIDSLAQLAMVADSYNAHPVPMEEFAKWNSMHYMSQILPLYEVLGKGAAPKSLDDWKGMRIRALGPQGAAMSLLGAVPTSMPAPEVYIAVDRGLVDAVAFAYYSHIAYRIYEPAKWFTKGLKLGSINCGMMFNLDSYNSLPPQYKELMEDYRPIGYRAQIAAFEEAQGAAPAIFREAGLTEIEITEAERQKFADIAAQPVWKRWVEKMNEAGYDGQELLDLILNSAEKYKDAEF